MKAPSSEAAKLAAPCFGILEKERDEHRSSRSILLSDPYADQS
jgi:hypothetical protein